jgi:hypothetical protein
VVVSGTNGDFVAPSFGASNQGTSDAGVALKLRTFRFGQGSGLGEGVRPNEDHTYIVKESRHHKVPERLVAPAQAAAHMGAEGRGEQRVRWNEVVQVAANESTKVYRRGALQKEKEIIDQRLDPLDGNGPVPLDRSEEALATREQLASQGHPGPVC